MESAILPILVLIAVVAIMVIAAFTRTRDLTSRTRSDAPDWGIPALIRINSEKTASGSRVNLIWQSKTASSMHAGVSVSVDVVTGSAAVPLSVLKTVVRIAFDTVNEHAGELNFAGLYERREKIAEAVDTKLAEEFQDSLACRTSIDVSVYYPAYSRW